MIEPLIESVKSLYAIPDPAQAEALVHGLPSFLFLLFLVNLYSHWVYFNFFWSCFDELYCFWL